MQTKEVSMPSESGLCDSLSSCVAALPRGQSDLLSMYLLGVMEGIQLSKLCPVPDESPKTDADQEPGR